MQTPSARTTNVILIPVCVFLLLLLIHRGCGHCPDAPPALLRSIYDTTYLKTGPVEIKTPVPYPRQVAPVKDTQDVFVFADEDGYSPYAQGYKDATEAFMKVRHTCRDTAFYNDTIISKDNWRLILLESLTGNRIVSRKPFVEDLRPIISTVTQLPAPKEHIRFYGGADINLNAANSNRWGIGLAGILTLPQGYAIRYGYDLRNNTHTAGVYVLVRVKK